MFIPVADAYRPYFIQFNVTINSKQVLKHDLIHRLNYQVKCHLLKNSARSRSTTTDQEKLLNHPMLQVVRNCSAS